MLRLSEEEHRLLLAAKPDGQDLAAFARAALVGAPGGRSAGHLRRVASFIVASLSPDITFEEALVLFDEHVFHDEKEAADAVRQ